MSRNVPVILCTGMHVICIGMKVMCAGMHVIFVLCYYCCYYFIILNCFHLSLSSCPHMFIMKAAYRIGGRSINAYTIEHSILGCRSHRPTQVRHYMMHRYTFIHNVLNSIDIMKYWQSMWSAEFTHSHLFFLVKWMQSLLLSGSKFKSGDERRSYAIKNSEPLVCFALCCGGWSDPAVCWSQELWYFILINQTSHRLWKCPSIK